MLRTFCSGSTRCAVIGCGLLAGSVALQGLSHLIWAEPARTRTLLEFIVGARGPLLQALNVMALALVTTGILRARLAGSAVICAAWALVACLIELAQHPAVVNRLLQWTETTVPRMRVVDATLGLFWNSRFAWFELLASIVGSGAAFEVVHHYSRTKSADSAVRV